MKITKEIKTAILVIAAILLFIWGYSFLKGRDLLNDYKTFYVQYENVEGLGASAPVTLNGFVIGKVSNIKLQSTTGFSLVELQIKSDFPISRSSLANLYEPGFIGGKQIQIVPDFNNQVLAKDGDVLNGEEVPGLTALLGQKLTPLQEKLEKMVVSADILLNNINTVLDAKTKENIKSSVANLNETLIEFKTVSGTVNTMLTENKGKIGSTITNINKASSNFATLSDSLSKIQVGKTVKSLEQTLAKIDGIVSEIEAGKGTLGKLAKDDKLYNNFTKSSKELELLLQDLRLNPIRYINISVFGKKNKPYVAPKVPDSIANPTP